MEGTRTTKGDPVQRKAMTIQTPQVAVAVTLCALVLLAVKLVLQTRFPTLNFDGASTIALAVLAAAPWLARLVDLVKVGNVELTFKKIENQQTLQGALLAEHAKYLGQILDGLVGDDGKRLLESVRDRKPYPYVYDPETKQEFRTMLRQLRFLGFITTKIPVSRIIDDKRPKVDLSQEVVLTQAGAHFLSSPMGRALGSPETLEGG
jgi:hypothetical protein